MGGSSGSGREVWRSPSEAGGRQDLRVENAVPTHRREPLIIAKASWPSGGRLRRDPSGVTKEATATERPSTAVARLRTDLHFERDDARIGKVEPNLPDSNPAAH
jgi:hypothetical protein